MGGSVVAWYLYLNPRRIFREPVSLISDPSLFQRESTALVLVQYITVQGLYVRTEVLIAKTCTVPYDKKYKFYSSSSIRPEGGFMGENASVTYYRQYCRLFDLGIRMLIDKEVYRRSDRLQQEEGTTCIVDQLFEATQVERTGFQSHKKERNK